MILAKAVSTVYAGSIGGPHYNPEQMIEIFKQISITPKRILHLYTRGPEADRIAAMAKAENLNVRVHGYVDATALESIMATADVIVSLKRVIKYRLKYLNACLMGSQWFIIRVI
mgnify:CR=1 FL=1